MSETTLMNYRKQWEKLCDKGFAQYESLTPDERIWFNTECFIGTVNNGGLIGHYCNYGAERNKETIEDLNTLGFPAISNLLLQINTWFPGGNPSSDLELRNKVIASWEDAQYEELLEKYDEQFGARCDELEKALVNHIESKGLDKPIGKSFFGKLFGK